MTSVTPSQAGELQRGDNSTSCTFASCLMTHPVTHKTKLIIVRAQLK